MDKKAKWLKLLVRVLLTMVAIVAANWCYFRLSAPLWVRILIVAVIALLLSPVESRLATRIDNRTTKNGR